MNVELIVIALSNSLQQFYKMKQLIFRSIDKLNLKNCLSVFCGILA